MRHMRHMRQAGMPAAGDAPYVLAVAGSGGFFYTGRVHKPFPFFEQRVSINIFAGIDVG
jgi:hypothetical protein